MRRIEDGIDRLQHLSNSRIDKPRGGAANDRIDLATPEDKHAPVGHIDEPARHVLDKQFDPPRLLAGRFYISSRCYRQCRNPRRK
jgi:hypothetical protein